MRYPGGKGKTFQHIINVLPPHELYVETHLGGGAVLRNKRPASRSIGINLDEDVIGFWRQRYAGLAEFILGDALDFLRVHEFKPQDLIYCDPPFLPSTRKRARVYRHDLTEHQHAQLLDVLLRLPCSVVISGYGSELYDSMLKGWTKISFSAKAHDGLRQECLWMNYAIPGRLHDSRYIGTDFRERQNSRRRLMRLQRRISSLNEREQYLLSDWMIRFLSGPEIENE